MPNSNPLSDEQITFFKTHGYLILKNLIDEVSLEQWRTQTWHELGSSLDTPETWPRDRFGLDDYEYDPPESAFGRQPALTAIMAQLGGDDFMIGHGVPIIRWPEPDSSWKMPQTGHVDAYGGRWIPFMYGITAYLYDVAPKGGGLVFWPDSHHTAHQYFLKHPGDVDGWFLHKKDFTWDLFCDNPTTGAEEFVAKAGDVVLWHSYLTHNASTNVSHSPRFGMFARMEHRRRYETDFRYDIPEDLWKYWAI